MPNNIKLWFCVVVFLCLTQSIVLGQTQIDATYQIKNLPGDVTPGVTATGASVPGSCAIAGQLFTLTTGTYPNNLYICNGATYVLFTGGSGSGTVGSGTTGQFAYYSGAGTSVAGRTIGPSDLPLNIGWTFTANLTASGAFFIPSNATPDTTATELQNWNVHNALTYSTGSGAFHAMPYWVMASTGSAIPVSGHCVQWGANFTQTDTGLACGSGSGGVSTPTFTGIAKATNTSNTLTAAASGDVVALWTSCTSGYLAFNGMCGTPSGTLPTQSGFSGGGYALFTNGSVANWLLQPTGPTNALVATSTNLDIATAIVPTKTNSQVITASWTFQQGVNLNGPNSQPTCNTGLRGQFWFIPGTTGVSQDHVQVCAQNSGGSPVWTTVI